MSDTCVQVDIKDVPCRFCGPGSFAVGRYKMTAGCVCYPEDREQDLCAQHAMKATPLGDMVLMVIYRKWFYPVSVRVVEGDIVV